MLVFLFSSYDTEQDSFLECGKLSCCLQSWDQFAFYALWFLEILLRASLKWNFLLCHFLWNVHLHPFLLQPFSFMSLSSSSSNSSGSVFRTLRDITKVSLGDKEATRRHPLLSVHELNNRCSVASYWQTLNEVTWLVTDHNEHLLFTWWSVGWSSDVYTLCRSLTVNTL